LKLSEFDVDGFSSEGLARMQRLFDQI
jgi:hypothetical protein